SSHVQNAIKDRHRWVISLSRELGGEGVLLVDLNFSVIDDICNSVTLGTRGYIFIVAADGSIVYHPQQQLIYGGLKGENIQRIIEGGDVYFAASAGGADKLYSVKTMKATGWKVVGVNYGDELVANREKIRLNYLAWGLGFFATTIILSILIARSISRPIKSLRASMRAVELGDFDIRVDIQSDDEIGELGKDFNIMIAKIRELIRLNTQQQELKRRSELKALQMQINPHFLYNTLDSIIWMAEGRKEEEVITMVSALAKLFRLGISKGQEIIPIGQEIEHVESYLTIQKIRYKDKLDYEISVDPEIRRFRTVKLILQPLVENAIYHGIKNKAEAGKIVVSGRRTETGVELAVSDDGVGMGAEQLQSLLSRSSEPNGNGLGVRNVDERIKLYFGDEYGLMYESAEDEGTTVRVRLPAWEEMEA
ncbi:MAG: histidine kinase, partial [Treponema sp. RIFOXYC1_FULL_61_9]